MTSNVPSPLTLASSGTKWRIYSPPGSACFFQQWHINDHVTTVDVDGNLITYLMTLVVGIEDVEVWSRIDAGARTPLPTAVVGCKITVNEGFHEILWVAR